MRRILEPELMEDAEQALAYSEADFSEPHNRFVDKFDEMFPDAPEEGFALDLGCGPADVSCRFAKRHPGLVIHGVDGSEAMLAPGRGRIARLGLEQRVKLFRILLPNELPRPHYDIVISNSLLHHLPDPQILWATVKRAGTPGAPLFAMDLMRPESRRRAEQLTRLYAGGEPEVLRRDFFNSLLAAFTEEEVRRQLQSAGLESVHVTAASDRHLIVYGRL